MAGLESAVTAYAASLLFPLYSPGFLRPGTSVRSSLGFSEGPFYICWYFEINLSTFLSYTKFIESSTYD